MTGKALFKGSMTHPLSKEERTAFFDRIDLSGRRFSFGYDRLKMKSALDRVLDTPTGCEQARTIINYEPKDHVFKIEATPNDDDIFTGSGAAAGYSSATDKIYVRSDYLSDVDNLGQLLCHELMHARQPHLQGTSGVLTDSETHALSVQMSMELQATKSPSYDPSYNKSFATNKAKWLGIAKNPSKTPKGALRFETVGTVSQKELEQAQEAYAVQMASLETRSEYIKDFLKGGSKLAKGQDALPVASYNNRFYRLAYQHSDDLDSIFNSSQKIVVSPKMVAHLKSTYMGLSDSDFSDLKRRLMQPKGFVPARPTEWDLRDVTKSGKMPVALNYSLEDANTANGRVVLNVLKDVQDPALQNILNKYKNHGKMTTGEQAKLLFEYMKRDASVDKNVRVQRMIQIIYNHQQDHPEPNQERVQMIRDLEKVAGHKMPIVQNQSQQGGGLNARFKKSADLTPIFENQDSTQAYLSVQNGTKTA